MFQLLNWFTQRRRRTESGSQGAELSADVARYVASSYPHNHTYNVSGKQLLPHRQLRARSRAITSFYPRPMTSLIDLSCCKGYFVFDAGLRPTCERAMGIDVFERDVEVCRAVQQHTQSRNTHFHCMRLDQAADRIEEFGGPFQTALLINCYQYLFFGSQRGEGYLDHGAIFEHLARLCSRCVIFSNRTELADCQNEVEVARAGKRASEYRTEGILNAAAERFTVFPISAIGRYPLWLLVKR